MSCTKPPRSRSLLVRDRQRTKDYCRRGRRAETYGDGAIRPAGALVPNDGLAKNLVQGVDNCSPYVLKEWNGYLMRAHSIKVKMAQARCAVEIMKWGRRRRPRKRRMITRAEGKKYLDVKEWWWEWEGEDETVESVERRDESTTSIVLSRIQDVNSTFNNIPLRDASSPSHCLPWVFTYLFFRAHRMIIKCSTSWLKMSILYIDHWPSFMNEHQGKKAFGIDPYKNRWSSSTKTLQQHLAHGLSVFDSWNKQLIS